MAVSMFGFRKYIRNILLKQNESHGEQYMPVISDFRGPENEDGSESGASQDYIV